MVVSKKDVEKRLKQLIREMPARGFDLHCTILEDISDLPIELQSPAVMSLAAGESIQTIVVFPPQVHRGWHYVPRQALLFTSTDVTHLLASIWPGQEPKVTHLKSCELMYMKVSLLLLYGFLEMVACGEASPARLDMEFNTVSWSRLAGPMQDVLRVSHISSGARDGQPGFSPAVRPALESLPLKFSTGVSLFGLLPGEELLELVFQPAVWRRWLLFLHQNILANTLVLLTSNYVVVIQERLYIQYGWVLSYIPRDRIVEIQNQPRGLWHELTFRLAVGGQTADYMLSLQSEAVQSWRECWTRRGGHWRDASDGGTAVTAPIA